MIIVNERACNGADLSHWNGSFSLEGQRWWIQFFGHKATHPGGKGMVDGVDPKFADRRLVAATYDIPWRSFYMWPVHPSVMALKTQVALLAQTVRDLPEGESVYVDWEDKTLTLAMIDELTFYMDVVFGKRWFMYVNDVTSEMTSWMEANLKSGDVPLMHPNYNLELGLQEVRKWQPMIWQTGVGKPPGFTTDVVLDLVLRPDLLDWVSDR